MTEPLVSVCVIAYNHGQYIAKALDSIIEQKRDFPLEVVVLEDCSTDNTQAVLQEYKKRYPDILKVFMNEKNKGHFYNFRDGFKNVSGDYVAFLDGDDCWIDDHKLQKQINFLRSNKKYIGSSHNVRLVKDSGETEFLHKQSIAETVNVADLISGGVYFHTSSLVYRNIFKGGFPQEYYDKQTGDWFLSMLYADRGPIKYFSETMSLYRIHEGGMWSGLSPLEKKLTNINGVAAYNKLFNYKYKKYFSKFYWDILSIYKHHYKEMTFMELTKYFFLMISLFVDGKMDFFLTQSVVGRPCLFIYEKLSSVKGAT